MQKLNVKFEIIEPTQKFKKKESSQQTNEKNNKLIEKTKSIASKKNNIISAKKSSTKPEIVISVEKAKSIKTIVKKIKDDIKLNQEISRLCSRWISIMANCNLYNSENQTFGLSHINKEPYGWSCRIYTIDGYSFEDLDKAKTTIEHDLPCILTYKLDKNKNFVMAKIITEGFPQRDFEVLKAKPYEIYIGDSVDGKPVIISMWDYPHVLLSGSNGSGKSRMLDCIITNLICNCTTKELELYLIQVAKNDLVIYEDVEHCKAFADDLDKTEVIVNYIEKEMNRRSALIRPLRKQGKGSNFIDYNRINPNDIMSVNFVIFDEMASIMDNSGDEDKIKKQKQRIVSKIEKIAQYGRALGIFGIFCLQRPQASMLSSFVKSQSNLRISFKQNNSKSSEIAMDDSHIALNLPKRIAVYLTYDYDFIKTPDIDDNVIITNIKPYCNSKHKTLYSKDDENNEYIEPKGQTKEEINKASGKVKNEELDINKKTTISEEIAPTNQNDIKQESQPTKETYISNLSMNFDKVDPDINKMAQEELLRNISRIPNYVPYNPFNKPKNIIDQTDIPTNTEKPIKGGKIRNVD